MLARWLVGLPLVLALPGCNPVEPATAEDVCDDVRRAIGLRTEACTGDEELADRRYSSAAGLACKARTVEASQYDCSQTILGYPCETVAALGDDLPRWVDVAACAPLFVGPSVGVCTHAADGTCACLQVKETPICELPPPSDTATPYCCSEGNYPADGFCVCRYVRCVEQGDTCTCSASEELTGTPTLSCAKNAKPEYQECCAGNGLCVCRAGQGCTGNTYSVPACTPQTLCGGQVVTTCSR